MGHGDGDEVKDWDILSEKYSFGISYLGSRFRMVGHLILTRVISAGGDVAGH